MFFAAGAAARGLWHADEHRIAEVAREMTAPGGDALVPHLAGELYTHKPPLVAWIAAFGHDVLALDLAFAARVPSILGGALSVLAVFLIGRRLYGTAAGVAAAFVLGTAAEFDWICRRAQYDPLLTGFTALALWSFARSRFPAPDERPTPWRDAVLGSVFAGLAMLVKGPVVLVFTVPVILVFAFAAREARTLLSVRAVALLLVVAVPLAWLVPVAMRAGTQFAWDLVVGRLAAQTGDDDSKREAIWYYLVALPKGLLPFTFLVPAAALALTRWRRDEERRADLFVIAWTVVPFVIMSFVPSKRDLYLLPLYPGAALAVGKLAALAPSRFAAPVIRWPLRGLGGLAAALGVAVAAGGAAALFGVARADVDRVPGLRVALQTLGTGGTLLVAAMGAVVALLGWQALRAATAPRALDRVMAAAFLGTMAFATQILPAADPSTSGRSFYEKAGAVVGAAPLARYGVDDFAAHWVLRRTDVPYLAEKAAAERFLAAAPGPNYVVAEDDTLARKGTPAGAVVVLTVRLPLAKDLVLLRSP